MKKSLLNNIERNKRAEQRVIDAFVNNAQSVAVRDLQSSKNGNAKHDQAWADYGYPESVDFDDLYNMWDRFGIAKAGVNLPVDFGWMDQPRITESEEEHKETEWESLTKSFFKKKKLLKKLKGADWRNRVGEYSAFIVQVQSDIPEEIDWETPLSSVSLDKILRFIPVTQGQLEPNGKSDPKSERYPLPEMYSLIDSNDNDSLDTSDQNRDSVNVHYSRVIIFAEGADDDTLRGIPANKSGYNALLDLEKVSGAGAEGFWLAISQKLALESAGGRAPSAEEREIINNSFDDVKANFSSHFYTGNMKITPINASMPSNYKDPFSNALNIYAASVGIPATMVIGSQTGRLASDEDGKHFAKIINSRRNNWQTEMVESVIDWLDMHTTDYNPPDDYVIEWDDLLENSFSEKVESLDKVASAVQKISNAQAVGNIIITEDEARSIIELGRKEEQLDMFEEGEQETDLND